MLLYIKTILTMGFIISSSYQAIGQAQGNAELQNMPSFEEYVEVGVENFRQHRPFKAKVDLEKIDYTKLHACMYFIVNEKRKEKHLPALKYSVNLEAAAWHHAKIMHDKGFFSHHNPYDKTRETPAQRAKLAGITNPKIAENIALQTSIQKRITYLELAEIFIKQWLASPGHRANILSEKALSLGVGIYAGEKGVYAVQTFQWFQPLEICQAQDKMPE